MELEILDSAWKRQKEKEKKLSVSVFEAAPEHARGFGLSEKDCTKPLNTSVGEWHTL